MAISAFRFTSLGVVDYANRTLNATFASELTRKLSSRRWQLWLLVPDNQSGIVAVLAAGLQRSEYEAHTLDIYGAKTDIQLSLSNFATSAAPDKSRSAPSSAAHAWQGSTWRHARHGC